MSWELNRRALLRTGAILTGAAAMGSFAGRTASAAGKLEIFSWWTSGGEAAALKALTDAYTSKFPGTDLVNAAVAGGGGTNAQSVLQARLAGGNPPDSWQGNSGTAFFDQYVTPEFVEDITSLYQSEGWEDKVPPAVLDLIRKDGKYYAVHVGAHRCNEVWYNKKLLDKHGVEVGDTLSWDQFFAAAEKLKKAGVNALSVGDNGIWANARIFENTFTGLLGYEQTQKLWKGELAFDSPEMKEAMKLHLRVLEFQNPDHSALSWDQAIGKVIDGSSAFNMHGDWAYGEFKKANAKEGEDYGWVSHPGTDDIFIIVTDCFTSPKGAPNAEEARNWLKSVGSADTQLAFSLNKGSVAPRLDVDKTKLPPYLQWSYEKFAKNKFVGSSVNGEQVPAAFVQAHMDALTTFVVNKNVDRFAAALVEAQQAINNG
jgi:glucose/mannose transport system substrate-binding protein